MTRAQGGASIPGLAPVVISAPFGNYVQPAGTTPTLGTFTAARRGGRAAAVGRAALTMRHYRRLGAWVNRIGLRNPGIDAVAHGTPNALPLSESVISIHGFVEQDWDLLLRRIGEHRPLAVELNISCPNVGELSWPPTLFRQAVDLGVPVIVKIPPIRFRQLASDAVAGGVRAIHACNTLPVRGGGLSGAPLKPISLGVVRWLRDEFGANLTIIGGGGIATGADVGEFARAGADHFAVGTHCIRPSAPFRTDWISDILSSATSSRRGVAAPLPRRDPN